METKMLRVDEDQWPRIERLARLEGGRAMLYKMWKQGKAQDLARWRSALAALSVRRPLPNGDASANRSLLLKLMAHWRLNNTPTTQADQRV